MTLSTPPSWRHPRGAVIVCLLSTMSAAPGFAQTVLKARANSMSASDATIENGVLTAAPQPGGTATGGPTGPGVTSQFVATTHDTPTMIGGFPVTLTNRSRADVDLASGILRGTVANSPQDQFGFPAGLARSEFQEDVDFANTTGGPVTVPLVWTVNGTITPNSVPSPAVYTNVGLLQVANINPSPMPRLRGTPAPGGTQQMIFQNASGAKLFYSQLSGQTYPVGSSASWQIDPIGASGARMESALIVPPGISRMRVTAWLALDCRAGTSCGYDGSAGARVELTVPQGVIMTSTSGVFLGAGRPSAVPTGLTVASVVGNRVTLDWNPPTTALATGYVLEGGVTPGQVLASVPTGSAATTLSFDAPTGAFFLRVHALTAAGRTAASNEVRAFVNVPRAPSAPTGLLGLTNGSTLGLSWKNTTSGGAPTSMLLDVSGAIAATLPIGPTEVFAFGSVPAGTYTFAVRAANATGASAASAPVTLTFPGACSGSPQTPLNLAVTRAGHQLTLTWDPPAAGPAVAGYVLSVSGPVSLALPVTTRSIAGPVPAGAYTFRVRASNACGQSANSPAQAITVP